MPPKMRKRWMHREVEAMKEAVASDREVVMQLEEPPGMVRLGIRFKESSGTDQLGMFSLFFFTIYALGLMLIGFVDEQHLMPPPPFVRSTAPSSTGSNAVAVPSISPLSRFVDLSLRSPAIPSLVSNSPAVQ